MANKVCNAPFDQIPHIVLKHPEATPDHKEIMRVLYKVLKDKKTCTYSNEALANECNISERNVRRRLIDLEKWQFINRTGISQARRFTLGLLFNSGATVADPKLNSPANVTVGVAKLASQGGHSGLHTKNSTKNSTKNKISFSSLTHSEKKEILHCLENGFALAEEFKYLQPFLEECLQ